MHLPLVQRLLCVFVLGFLASRSAHALLTRPESVAILGDSGATGFVANPKWFQSRLLDDTLGDSPVDLSPFAKLYASFGVDIPLVTPPNRIQTKSSVFNDDAHQLIERRIDAEEMSWGYLAGRALGTASHQIHVIARDKDRVSELSTQMEMLQKSFPATLPELILVQFNAGDFCDESILDPAIYRHTLGNYQTRLRSELQKILKLRPHRLGTHVVLVAPLPIANVLASEAIANKVTRFSDVEFRCGEVRGPTLSPLIDSNSLYQLRYTCPSVMNTDSTDTSRINQIRDIFGSVGRAQAATIAGLQADDPGFLFEHHADISDLPFEPQDIASDCFHPSLYGNAKIARSLIEFLRKAPGVNAIR